jgi:hypothetical protein
MGRAGSRCRALAGVATIALAAAGCGEEESDLPAYSLTAAGYKITVPTIAAGHSARTVGDLLDARIEEWVAEHPERDPSTLRGVARQYQFIVVDDWRFATAYSPTGYASGMIWMTGELNITLALYGNAARRDAGDLAGGLPATHHELDHAIGMTHQDMGIR